MDEPEIERIAVPAGAGAERLDRFLAASLADLSRSRLQALIGKGRVSIDGRTIVDASHRVKPGETVTLAREAPDDPEPVAQDIPLDVLYEDADLIVIDKPAGMVVHPAAGNPDGTLVNALIGHCGDSLSGIGGVRRPGIVHRLDKDTSGVMVAAKSDAAHQGLSALFASHDIERVYMAVLRGRPARLSGTVEGAIGRDPADRKRMAIVARGGKHAVTHYHVAEAFGTAAALAHCTLETGRTHQIRVHMASLGHPLLGDALYARRRGLRPVVLPETAKVFPRQALHAAVLGFRHPVSGEPLRFQRDMPADMAELIRALRTGVDS